MKQPLPSSRVTIARRSARGRDAVRAVAAACVLVALLAVAIGFGSEWRLSALTQIFQAGALPPPADNPLTTGAMVFVPDVGDDCRQNEIDNATWQVREIGIVSCREALSDQRRGRAGSGSSSSRRIDIIRDSFRKTSP
jgi:hypothetical protein